VGRVGNELFISVGKVKVERRSPPGPPGPPGPPVSPGETGQGCRLEKGVVAWAGVAGVLMLIPVSLNILSGSCSGELRRKGGRTRGQVRRDSGHDDWRTLAKLLTTPGIEHQRGREVRRQEQR
jgi:hypothetical protein